MKTYTDNLWSIDDCLQAAMDKIKETLLQEHPNGSGDELVKISNKITEARHLLTDLRYNNK